MTTVRMPTSRALHTQPARPAVPNRENVPLIRPRSTALYLINEAMARARMREPQIESSEAYRIERRSARRIAMRSLREQDRRLGGR